MDSAVQKGGSKPWTKASQARRSERQWHGRVARSQAHHICVQARGNRPERRATPTASCRPLALKTGRRCSHSVRVTWPANFPENGAEAERQQREALTLEAGWAWLLRREGLRWG